MSSQLAAVLLLGSMASVGAPAPKDDPDVRAKYLISRLDARVPEIEKGDIALPFLLDTLAPLASEPGFEKDPQLSFQIIINQEAFRKVTDGMFDAERTQIKIPTKLTNEPLSFILRTICDQIDGAYVVRRNHIEIIPMQALRKELRVPDEDTTHFAPLVCWIGSDVPLERALNEISRRYDANILLSPAAKEGGKSVISARLLNAPVDAAVGMLAEMADLKLVRRSNVLLVTTKDHASALEVEQDRRKRSEKSPGKTQMSTEELMRAFPWKGMRIVP